MPTEDILEYVGWARILLLALCFGGAAWLDHKLRRVSNDWWDFWARPTLALLVLELYLLEADLSVWLTASAAVAFASTALFGRPSLTDIKAGSRVDILVSIWYLVSAAGLVMGAMSHGQVLLEYLEPSTPVASEAERMGLLWGRMIVLLVVLFFFEMAWRFRLLHGGADAKAMMLVALMVPSWYAMPFPTHSTPVEMAMPPALSLMIWAGLAFLLLPVIMLARNLKAGDAGNLRMAWHSFRMPLQDIPNNHVWLLEEMVDGADGERSIEISIRPMRGSRSETDVEAVLAELAEAGSEKAWVTAKYPFLLLVFPAIIPLIILGDPVSTILGCLGLI